MRKIVLFMLLLFAVFAIGTSGALASTINFDASHVFNLTVQRESTSGYLAPVNGNIQTGFTDYAHYNPDEGAGLGSNIQAVVVGSPSSVTRSDLAKTWLVDRTTTVGYSGPVGNGYGGSISHNFTAKGPDPDLALNGLVGQRNDMSAPRLQLLHLEYNIGADDTYKINFLDTYTSEASVNQATGSAFDVSYFSGYAIMGVKITAGQSFSDNAQLLYDNTVGTSGSSTPIASFFDILTNETFELGSFEYLMTAGQKIKLDVYLTSYYNAETTGAPQVPVPPAVLLLGTGLIGLLGIRRKFGK